VISSITADLFSCLRFSFLVTCLLSIFAVGILRHFSHSLGRSLPLCFVFIYVLHHNAQTITCIFLDSSFFIAGNLAKDMQICTSGGQHPHSILIADSDSGHGKYSSAKIIKSSTHAPTYKLLGMTNGTKQPLITGS
jgi:hypothetical protein